MSKIACRKKAEKERKMIKRKWKRTTKLKEEEEGRGGEGRKRGRKRNKEIQKRNKTFPGFKCHQFEIARNVTIRLKIAVR